MTSATALSLPAFASTEDFWAKAGGVFRERGLVVLLDVLPGDALEMLREEADRLKRQVDGAFTLCGVKSHAGTTADRSYSIAGRHAQRPRLCQLIADPVMEQLCLATIGRNGYLFTDQFLMKGPHSQMDFNWHQDGAYVSVPHDPFVVVWMPIDDVDLENGTIRVIPFDRHRPEGLQPHRMHPDNHDLVGYDGADRGDPVACPAGSIVAFDSRMFHASDDNTSDRWRRIYQIRFTPEPLLNPETGGPLHFAKQVFGA